MAAIVAPPSGLRRIPSSCIRNRRRPSKRLVFSVTMSNQSAASPDAEEGESISGNLHITPRFHPLEASSSRSDPEPSVVRTPSDGSDLRFNRRRPSDDECNWYHRRFFGRFAAQEALLVEEFWTAARLRAECHWENNLDARHVESHKRQFAEQEFSALRKRCSKQLHAKKCICIIAVKNYDGNVKRTVVNSIVGTVDLTIQHLLSGETFPGERAKQPSSCTIYQSDQPKYAYMANLCVAKHYRRQGIATNMLLLATEASKSYGISQIYVHVHRDNPGAQKLYDKIGFQIVEAAAPHLLTENKHLLYLKI